MSLASAVVASFACATSTSAVGEQEVNNATIAIMAIVK
jgi:hypothetical protein